MKYIKYIFLIILLTITTTMIYKMSENSLLNAWSLLISRFNEESLIDPIIIYICTSSFLFLSSLIITLLLLSGVETKVKSKISNILITFSIVYIIYIGPIFLFLLLLLYNVSTLNIALILSILSFVNVSIQRGKEFAKTGTYLAKNIYNKLNDFI